jgi:hypothetical protein
MRRTRYNRGAQLIRFLLAGLAVISLLPFGDASVPPRDPAYALFRLPDHHDESCLTCHDIERPDARILRISDASRFASHVRGRFPRVSSTQLDQLRSYLESVERSRVQRRNLPNVPLDDARLLESMRGLGYVEYQGKVSPPRLSRRISLNAYALWSRAIGTTLLKNPVSPTGRVLRFGDDAVRGIVLEPMMVEKGRYRIIIRALGELPKESFRLLILNHQKSACVTVQLRGSASKPAQAEATFSIETSALCTLSLVPSGKLRDIVDLEILREEL